MQVLILYMLLYMFQYSEKKMLCPVSNILLLFRKRPIFFNRPYHGFGPHFAR